MRAGWARVWIRYVLQIAAIGGIVVLFQGMTSKIRQAGDVVDAGTRKKSEVSPDVQEKIVKTLISGELMTNLDKPRPLFEFILEPMEKIEAMKMLTTKVRWTAVNMIKTAITNKDRRDAIRETWGGVHLWKGVQITTIFILGNTSNKELQESVEQEYREFGDILQTNTEEGYGNIAYKTLAGMQWAAQVMPSNWLYSSGDDDFALHISNFVRFIESTAFHQTGTRPPLHKTMEFMPIMCIFSYTENESPARDPRMKWYISRRRYSLPYWPPYCKGGWYSIPVATVARLYNVSRYVPFLSMDDVWITGLMRVKMLAELEEIEEKHLWNAAIIEAPLSRRNYDQLFVKLGEDDLSKVLVSHMWGNIDYLPNVNVVRSLRETWRKWEVSMLENG